MVSSNDKTHVDIIYKGAMSISALSVVYLATTFISFRDDQIKYNTETSKLLVRIVSRIEHQKEISNDKFTTCKERCSDIYNRLNNRLNRLEKK